MLVTVSLPSLPSNFIENNNKRNKSYVASTLMKQKHHCIRKPQNMNHTCLILWNLPQKEGHAAGQHIFYLELSTEFENPSKSSLPIRKGTQWPLDNMVMEKPTLKNHVDKLFLGFISSLLPEKSTKRWTRKYIKNKDASTIKEGEDFVLLLKTKIQQKLQMALLKSLYPPQPLQNHFYKGSWPTQTWETT